ncbi:hypothetical protein [Nostoc sp. FACHB-110]|nr:hypothetical protein [Nostoc sp. FACHB-110]MBD2438241.1 hypothetical protein [Nostoc sp. FACHB-110]
MYYPIPYSLSSIPLPKLRENAPATPERLAARRQSLQLWEPEQRAAS